MSSAFPLWLLAQAPDLPNWLNLLWPIALVCVLGCASIYLLLPRPRPYPAFAGAGLGAVTLVLAGWLLARGGGVTVEMALFFLFSAIAVVSGTLLITQVNPAHAALSFTLVILSSCGLFLLLAAPFLMAATIIIYAGAIVVTFLFVLMLAQQIGLSSADVRSREPLFAAIAGFLFLGALLFVLDAVFIPRDYEKAQAQLRQLSQQVDRIRQAAQANSSEEIEKALGADPQKFLIEFKADLLTPQLNLKKQADEIENQDLQGKWPDGGDEQKKKLQQLLAIAVEARTEARRSLAQTGLQQLDAEHVSRAELRPLVGDRPRTDWVSNLSGPSPMTPPEELRTDPRTGVPQLPADNSTYLGRSLFTDYLLPVELGGFLLLVAVVGAIAIAQRTGSAEKVA